MITKVIAGPGSGKSTFIVNKIKESDFSPSQVGVTSFSRSAAKSMKEKLQKFCNYDDRLLHEVVGTQHSFNFRALGLSKDQLAHKHLKDFRETMQIGLSDQLIASENIKSKKDEDTLESDAGNELLTVASSDDFYNTYKSMRNRGTPTKIPKHLAYYETQYLNFVNKYNFWLKRHDFYDFTRMIEEGIERKIVPPVEMLCIDEAQDLSPLQYKQLHYWSEKIPHTLIVGDPDQAIYEFMGAAPELLLNFPCDKEVFLDICYRSGPDIVDLTQKLIKHNSGRKNYEFKSHRTETGEINLFSQLGDLSYKIRNSLKGGETWFVLIRNNFLKKFIIPELQTRNIPVNLERDKIDAINLMQGGKEIFTDVDLMTIMLSSLFPTQTTGRQGYWKYGVKSKNNKNSLYGLLEGSKIKSLRRDQLKLYGGTELLEEDLRNRNIYNLKIESDKLEYTAKMMQGYGDNASNLSVMSIHAAKGMEADNVLVLRDTAKATYEHENHEGTESERRVFYTAMTRAKSNLFGMEIQYGQYGTMIF